MSDRNACAEYEGGSGLDVEGSDTALCTSCRTEQGSVGPAGALPAQQAAVEQGTVRSSPVEQGLDRGREPHGGDVSAQPAASSGGNTVAPEIGQGRNDGYGSAGSHPVPHTPRLAGGTISAGNGASPGLTLGNPSSQGGYLAEDSRMYGPSALVPSSLNPAAQTFSPGWLGTFGSSFNPSPQAFNQGDRGSASPSPRSSTSGFTAPVALAYPEEPLDAFTYTYPEPFSHLRGISSGSSEPLVPSSANPAPSNLRGPSRRVPTSTYPDQTMSYQADPLPRVSFSAYPGRHQMNRGGPLPQRSGPSSSVPQGFYPASQAPATYSHGGYPSYQGSPRGSHVQEPRTFNYSYPSYQGFPPVSREPATFNQGYPSYHGPSSVHGAAGGVLSQTPQASNLNQLVPGVPSSVYSPPRSTSTPMPQTSYPGQEAPESYVHTPRRGQATRALVPAESQAYPVGPLASQPAFAPGQEFSSPSSTPASALSPPAEFGAVQLAPSTYGAAPPTPADPGSALALPPAFGPGPALNTGDPATAGPRMCQRCKKNPTDGPKRMNCRVCLDLKAMWYKADRQIIKDMEKPAAGVKAPKARAPRAPRAPKAPKVPQAPMKRKREEDEDDEDVDGNNSKRTRRPRY
ncbi:hypothetical protein B0H63DRAFT_529114 [Podospora didyma]|uniref:Uncharacterized protein n=1 Tax=Podospora didyma TaxID=330526 RepID=A0AAE0N3D5_9PEZI|nr:hypothetical protein B0H63DRAFT_529114 [Podospora didyma]